MYQSEGKAPNGDPFLTVKRARGYYEYSERPGLDSIAFILYDSTKPNCFCLINEAKPPLDERTKTLATLTTAFGGSKDSNMPSLLICKQEVLEEAGYNIPIKNIHYVGCTMVSTQSSQFLEAYLVDVTNLQPTYTTECDSTPNEYLTWLTPEQLIMNSDWKSIFILTKSKEKGLL